MMKIECITIFPEMFAPLEHSIIGRAQKNELFSFNTIYLRNFAVNEYGQVDDSPYGGEPGMVLRPEPLARAIQSTHVKEDGGKVIYLRPSEYLKRLTWFLQRTPAHRVSCSSILK